MRGEGRFEGEERGVAGEEAAAAAVGGGGGGGGVVVGGEEEGVGGELEVGGLAFYGSDGMRGR